MSARLQHRQGYLQSGERSWMGATAATCAGLLERNAPKLLPLALSAAERARLVRAGLIGWQPPPVPRVVRKRAASVPWAQATRVAEKFLAEPGRWASQAECAAEHRMALQTLNSAIWRVRSLEGRAPRHDKRRDVA